MKTYCKNLVVSDAKKIYYAITEYMSDKYRKGSSVRFYANFIGVSREYIREHFKPNKECLDQIEHYGKIDVDISSMSDDAIWKLANLKLAYEMACNIRNRTVKEHVEQYRFGLPLIRYTKIKDKGSGKERILGLETVLFRLYEVVAQDAAAPLFDAKVGVYQCSSIKGKGQSFGKKAVKKWLSRDVDGTKYYTKADIRKCYPSIPHGRLTNLLRRDLRKSGELLYLFETFIEIYEEWPSPEAIAPDAGILIGSPVSKDLCNYYLSYAYHFSSEQLVKTSCRRGQVKTKRLVSHVIFYADDIVLYGGNKKDLQVAMNMVIQYMDRFLGLTIKPDWIKTKSMYAGKDGKEHGGLLDYMGFRFHGGAITFKEYFGRVVKHRKVWVTIRDKIFLNARRKMKVFSKLIRRHVRVSIKFVMSLTSQYGWFKNTNMIQYRKKHRLDKLLRIARKIISDHAKGKEYNEEKYYKMWRRYCA